MSDWINELNQNELRKVLRWTIADRNNERQRAEAAEHELAILRRENIDLLTRSIGFESALNAIHALATERRRPKTTEREKINIESETKEQLREYLMAQSSSGEGYSEFIAKALEWRKWVDAYRKSQAKVAQGTSPFVSEWEDPRDEEAIFGKDQMP